MKQITTVIAALIFALNFYGCKKEDRGTRIRVSNYKDNVGILAKVKKINPELCEMGPGQGFVMQKLNFTIPNITTKYSGNMYGSDDFVFSYEVTDWGTAVIDVVNQTQSLDMVYEFAEQRVPCCYRKRNCNQFPVCEQALNNVVDNVSKLTTGLADVLDRSISEKLALSIVGMNSHNQPVNVELKPSKVESHCVYDKAGKVRINNYDTTYAYVTFGENGTQNYRCTSVVEYTFNCNQP